MDPVIGDIIYIMMYYLTLLLAFGFRRYLDSLIVDGDLVGADV